ncbi:uncharacterized protein LOC119733385 isoform X2 [Patiria miniata]|uniref:ZP domain-containing protein n=1 Tax=Patiria miniata TaxID=46514 RepID=A0A914AHN5_PATMI|nr:uncharacterized protein LOC119733385 isoform X2 [Patiria miniata]
MGGLLQALLVIVFLQGCHCGEVRSSHVRDLTLSVKAAESQDTVDVSPGQHDEQPAIKSLQCSDSASPPVILETWPDPAVTRIPIFADWTFHFKFNQNVNRATRPAFVKVYYRVGAWVFSIDASAGDNVHFSAPDTMQVVVPANLKALLAGGQVFHVLLDEGVVTGPGPCYVPSAAVTDPNFYKVLNSGLPDRYYDTPYYTTPAPPSSCSDTERPTVIQSWPADGFYSSLSIAKLTLKYDREVTVAQSLTGVYIYRRHAWQSAQNCKIVQTAVDTIETDCYSSMNLDLHDLDGNGVFTIIMAEDVVTGPAPCNAPSGWLAITLSTGSPPATDGAPTYAYTTEQFGDWTTRDNPGFQPTTEYWPTTQEVTESPFTEPATTPWMDCASMASPVVVEAWTNATVNLPNYSLIWNFRFDQHITKATSSSYAYARFYESSGWWRMSIPTWVLYNVRFSALDTLQVLVRDQPPDMPSYLPIGQEYYVLLDEGAVNGAAPCYIPSAAVNDTYLCRAVYGVAPNATDEVPIYTTHVLEDWTTSLESDNPTKQPTEFTTEEIGWSTHPPRMTQPPLLPSMDCSDSGMTVFIPRSVIGDALSSHLHFLDPACVGSHHNTTHVKIATTYDRCGTFMEVHGDSVIFFNVIHDEAVPVQPGSVITRDRDIEIPVQCIMDLEGFAEISFRPDTSKITFREDGFGSFNFSLRLYHGNDYTTPYQPADYPVQVAMGNKLYFEARTWSEPGLELFVQTCRATPTSNSDDFHRYTFIQDGCTSIVTWFCVTPLMHPRAVALDVQLEA